MLRGWIAAPMVLGSLSLATGCGVDPDRAGAALRGGLGAPDAGAKTCGGVTAVGCCSGSELVYCSASGPVTTSCAPGACGWSALFGLYICGSGAGSDPSGTHPRQCPAAGDAGADALTADAAAPDLGAPPEGGAAEAAVADAAAPGCGALTYQGCCNGSMLLFCSGSKLLALDCALAPQCGWNAAAGYYDCNTSGKPDPAGKHPLGCAALLGDAGVPDATSAPLDVGVDLTAADLLQHDGGQDQRTEAGLDGFTIPDAGGGDAAGLDGGGDGQGDGAGGQDGATGLDATGLDGSVDSQGRIVAGGGGCGSCVAAPARRPWPAPPALLLALGALGLAWRRRR